MVTSEMGRLEEGGSWGPEGMQDICEPSDCDHFIYQAP